MSDHDMELLARKLVTLERQQSAASRATQLPNSSVRLTDGEDYDLAQGMETAVEVQEDVAILNDYTSGISEHVDEVIDYTIEIPAWIQEAALTGDASWESAEFAVEKVEALDEELKAATEHIEAVSKDLNERMGAAETEITDASTRLDETAERLDATAITAEEALALAPLATSELVAVSALVEEAFIRTGHIIDLDVSKLIVTDTATMNEAVIEKLYSEVVAAKVVEITEKLIGVDGTFTGRLTADHLDVETLFGKRIEGLQIYGGSFVQYASGNYLPIYPTPSSWVEVGDWLGGRPEAIVPALENTKIKESGAHSATVARTNAGSLTAHWRNANRVPVRSPEQRRVSIRFMSNKPLTDVHMIVGSAQAILGGVPANTWTTISVDIPEGAAVEWAHLGANSTSGYTLYIDSLAVLAASLVGTHMRIDRDAAGIPGLYGYNAASEKLVSVTPTEVKTVVPVTGGYVRMTGQDIEFTPGGKMTGANTFTSVSDLQAWAPPTGTWAWVVNESCFFVRRGTRWFRDPTEYYNAGDTYELGSPTVGAQMPVGGVVTGGNKDVFVTISLPKVLAPGVQPVLKAASANGRAGVGGYWSLGSYTSGGYNLMPYNNSITHMGENMIQISFRSTTNWWATNNMSVSVDFSRLKIEFV